MKMTPILALAAALLTAGLTSGCKTMGTGTSVTPEQRAARVATVAEMAAYSGTTYWLSTHPDDRVYFEASRVTLGTLLGSTNISPADVAAAMAKLPVKQLQGDQGALIVGNAVILYDMVLKENVNLDANVYLRPIVAGIYSGLNRALAVPPVKVP